MRDRLARAYGLRLLFEPRFRATVLLMLAIIALGFRGLQFAALTAAPQWGYDVSAYWLAGRHLLEGAPLYTPAQLAGPYAPQGQFLYLYPPFLAALFTPLAALAPAGYAPIAAAWSAFGALILAATVLGIGRLEGLVRDRRTGLLLLAAALAFPPVLGELVLGNVHLQLLGLFGLAWWGVRRGDRTGELVAGVTVAVAALVKIFPLLLVLWFLLTGRRAAALATLIAIPLLVLAVLPLTGLQPWLDYPLALLNLSAPADQQDALAPTLWLAELVGFGPARVLVAAAALALIAWLSRRASTAAGFGATVAAALLVAPAVFHHYLSVLVLPMLLALAATGLRPWLAASYLAMWGGEQPILGAWGWVLNRGLPGLGALGVALGTALGGHAATSVRPGPQRGARRPGEPFE